MEPNYRELTRQRDIASSHYLYEVAAQQELISLDHRNRHQPGTPEWKMFNLMADRWQRSQRRIRRLEADR